MTNAGVRLVVGSVLFGALLAGCNCGGDPPKLTDGGTKKDAGTPPAQDAGVDAGVSSLSIDDVQVTEGADGGSAVFTVRLSPASDSEVTVEYATEDDTAVSMLDGGPGDYVATSGTLTFAAGTTEQTVSVSVLDDALDEPDERFDVRLLNPSGAVALVDKGRATIVDDDAPPALSVADSSVAEGNSGTAALTFTVTLSEPSGQQVKVNYATSDGTAIAGEDFTGTAGTLTFESGETSKMVAVDVTGDEKDEPNERFVLELSAPENATIAAASAQGEIVDDDDPPTVSAADVAVAEGNSGTTTLSFTLALSAPSAFPITIDYATADGTAISGGSAATGGEDYAAAAGTATFAPGDTMQTVDVLVNGDLLNELDETFLIVLTNPSQATIVDPDATGTIQNDDGLPALAVNDIAVVEGTGTTPSSAQFTVSLDAPSGQQVTVDYATMSGTASSSDFLAAAGMLTFPAGTTTQTVSVLVNPDTLDEFDETFTLVLANEANATVADGSGLATITDDDAEPSLSIGSVSVAEGDTGTTQAPFTITLSSPSGKPVTVDWATQDATATTGADYIGVSGTVTLNPGDLTATIDVDVLGETVIEPDETFTVVLSNAMNATVSTTTGTGTILDDDAAVPAISANDPSVTEGNTGTVTLTFTVALDTPTTNTVTVDYTTNDITATAGGLASEGGADYAGTSGTLTFAPGDTTKTVAVTVNGDTLYEADETLELVLSNASNATIADPSGVGTILNDDAQPSLSITDVVAVEGDAGTKVFTFTVNLTAPSQLVVSAAFNTADDTATTAGNDYVAANGSISFAAGVTTALVNVTVNGDTVYELTEAFKVLLSSPVNASISDGEGVGTISNDDVPPAVSITDVQVTEGDSGSTPATFEVTLSAASGVQVTVDYATANGTAVSGSDYVAASGTLTFPPGQTLQLVTVDVTGDTVDEANETFSVVLTNPADATIADASGTGTIINDDSVLPTLNINNVTVTEGDSGTVNMTFMVSLSMMSTQVITVDYATADGTAVAAADYTASSGTLTFNPGDLSKPVTVPVLGDTLDEQNETLFVDLSNAQNATIGDGQGQGTINDDDVAPTLSISDVAVTEGNSGTTNAVLTVTLSAASGRVVTVNYATGDGTAIAGGSAATGGRDYDSGSGTLTFNPGDTTTTITVAVNGDLLDEIDETFDVTLSTAVNATIVDGVGEATITNDDVPPTMTITDHTGAEGGVGAITAFPFQVLLSGASGKTITVNWATANGTAISGSDYFAGSGTVTIAPGSTSGLIAVPVIGDVAVEPDETFNVNLTNAANASVGDSQGVGTILNDD